MTIELLDGDLDDFFRQEEEAQKAAAERVKPWQKELKPGDYFVRDTPYGFGIYAEVLEPDEPYRGHMECYRFCKAFSVACPYGELGDIHISQVGRVLSREEFETARSKGWR